MGDTAEQKQKYDKADKNLEMGSLAGSDIVELLQKKADIEVRREDRSGEIILGKIEEDGERCWKEGSKIESLAFAST